MMHNTEFVINGPTIRGLTFNADAHSNAQFNTKEMAIFAMHGWLDNCASFIPLCQHLKPLTVHAVDLPGHGHSDHLPSGVPYHYVDGITHMVQVIEQLEAPDIVLLGHSLGGTMAAVLGAVLPERIKAWISIDAFGPIVHDTSRALDDLTGSIQRFLTVVDKKSPVYSSREKAQQVREAVGNSPQGLLHQIVERGTQRVDGGVAWRTDPRLRIPSALRFSEQHVETIMQGIKAPGLFIEAQDGLPLAKLGFKRRKAYVQAIEHGVVEGGHHAHIEHPQQCGDMILRFLRGIPELTQG